MAGSGRDVRSAHPRARVAAAWEAYAATRHASVEVQEAARRRYDAEVAAFNRAHPTFGVVGTVERERTLRESMKPARRLPKRDAWGYIVDDE